MSTASAIDRVAHHSVILGSDVPSCSTDVAQQRGRDQEVNRQDWWTPDQQECSPRDTPKIPW